MSQNEVNQVTAQVFNVVDLVKKMRSKTTMDLGVRVKGAIYQLLSQYVDVIQLDSGEIVYSLDGNRYAGWLSNAASTWNSTFPKDPIQPIPYHAFHVGVPRSYYAEQLGIEDGGYHSVAAALKLQPDEVERVIGYARQNPFTYDTDLRNVPCLLEPLDEHVTIDSIPRLAFRGADLLKLIEGLPLLPVDGSKFNDYDYPRLLISAVAQFKGLVNQQTSRDRSREPLIASIEHIANSWKNVADMPQHVDGKYSPQDIVQHLKKVSLLTNFMEGTYELIDDNPWFDTEDNEDYADYKIPHLAELAQPIKLLYSVDGGKTLSAATIISAEMQQSMFSPPYYEIKFGKYSFIRGEVEEVHVHEYASIDLSDIQMLPFSVLPELVTRGSKCIEILKSRSQHESSANDPIAVREYNGVCKVPGFFGMIPLMNRGNIVIDPRGCKQVETSMYRAFVRNFSFLADDVDENTSVKFKKPLNDIDDFVLSALSPMCIAFSMEHRRWVLADATFTDHAMFDQTIFDKLVLEEGEKANVRAIVDNLNVDFVDIVSGKGGGAIFLLHGPAGLGKTLTAEAVSAVSNRVLYKLSVGELGTNVEDLEQTLTRVLEYANRWGATLLIDEADIFLEKRDSHNIERNAMVAVFLRLLEYYPGILFLTTNRVSNFDPAFFSRITYAIGFNEQTPQQREKVWYNLLISAKISVDHADIVELSTTEINNRQIKTTIANAQRFAAAENQTTSIQHVKRAMQSLLAFNDAVRKQVQY